MTLIKNLTKQFANNFSFFHSKERNGQNYNATNKEKTMTNGIVLNVLNDEKIKDAKSLVKKMKIMRSSL